MTNGKALTKKNTKPTSIKKILGLTWLAGWLIWLPIAAQKAHLDYVHRVYSMYWHYENQLQGDADKAFARLGFKNAEARLATADPYIEYFFMIGLVYPLLIFVGGAWLIRHAGKVPYIYSRK